MPIADLPAVLALAALLVVAYLHPKPWVEAAAAVGAAAVALAPGVISLDEAWDPVRRLAPVVGFLVAILVVSRVCERAGLFAAAGRALRGGPHRRFTAAFLLAAGVTAVLSLDATVVLLTPVVVLSAASAGLSHRPAAYACLRMANSASLLLPVSNLTNLLAVPWLGLGFLGFAATMAPVWLAVLVVEYVGLRLLFRGDLRSAPASGTPLAVPQVSRFPVVVLAAMLVGFVVTSPFEVDPVWPAAAAAVVLVAWSVRRRLLDPLGALASGHPSFALFVLALGVVVSVIADGFLGEAVADLLPSSTSFAALLLVAVLATGLSAILTNLSAALLLLPLVAPLGDAAVLAALVGLDVGSGLTLSGSLANLLWRRAMAGVGAPQSVAAFHRVSLPLTPVALVVAVGVLHLVV